MNKTNKLPQVPGPIGIFDSGYGGLTILRQIRSLMPQYDYLYLGDNARAPYGTRSFDIVYEFTLQAVRFLFEQGCHLVILGCNTASAKALRSIQQNDLPQLDIQRRVLGVIRPTVEVVGGMSQSRHVGIMATLGTIRSATYELEIAKLHPDIQVTGEACPMWVPLVENEEYDGPGADYFVKKNIDNLLCRDPQIDSIILGCTHYPLLLKKIKKYMPSGIHVIEQGYYVANSLRDYLNRHPEMAEKVTSGGTVRFMTTEQAEAFQSKAAAFLGEPLIAKRVYLERMC
jgi:glutamate racemase